MLDISSLRGYGTLLCDNHLYIKCSKCSFGAFEVEYLGHIVSLDGVLVDPKKFETMKDLPHPKNTEKLAWFHWSH